MINSQKDVVKKSNVQDDLEILHEAVDVIIKSSYFEYEYISIEILVDIIHKTINMVELDKAVINRIVCIFLHIIKNAIINNKIVEIYNIGKFYRREEGIYRYYKSSYVLFKNLNKIVYDFDIFSIFKLISTSKGYKILEIEDQLIDNELIKAIKKYKRKIFIERKDIKNITYNFNSNIINRNTVINMIKSNAGIKNINKFQITKIIQQLILIFNEAIMLGIKLKITKFGMFYLRKIGMIEKKTNKAIHYIYINGYLKKKDIYGKLYVSFQPTKEFEYVLKKA